MWVSNYSPNHTQFDHNSNTSIPRTWNENFWDTQFSKLRI